jgi:hypothetical protein
LEIELNLDPDSNPNPDQELFTDPDPNLQIISDPSGSGCTTLTVPFLTLMYPYSCAHKAPMWHFFRLFNSVSDHHSFYVDAIWIKILMIIQITWKVKLSYPKKES